MNILSLLAVIALCASITNCSSELASSDAAPATQTPAGQPNVQEAVSRQCLTEQVKNCTASNPCSNGRETFNSPSDQPACTQDGGALSFTDAQGTSRYYCQYKPSTSSLKPLVIWLHGGSGSADNVYSFTTMRNRAVSSGFILVSLQSRNLQVNLARLNDGHHFDSWWWDVKAPSTNPDIDALDRLIDIQVRNNQADPQKIYLMGWSEGGMLAQLYGMARHETPSTYGHKVAAIVAFSASSPFHRKYENNRDCTPDILLKSQLPIFTMSRSCDVVACNKQQETDLWNRGSFADPINMEDWKSVLQSTINNANVTHVLLNKDNSVASACAVTCTLQEATNNHLAWPVSYEGTMLNFLFSH